MEYATFIAYPQSWHLHAGIGVDGPLRARRDDVPLLCDLSAARVPVLWICAQQADDGKVAPYRITLPELSLESVSWAGGRIGALASAPDGEKVVLLNLPADPSEQPTLWVGDRRSWYQIDLPVHPDISSKLAWLEGGRIVYESTQRRLTIFDMESDSVEFGPLGYQPAAAWGIREWYAICRDQVLCFPFDKPFTRRASEADGFDFDKAVTLRVSVDGCVFTWLVSLGLHRSKGYIQEKGKPRRRFRDIDGGAGLGAVLGPYELQK